MNDPSHTPQDSTERGDKSTSNCKTWGIACLLATLIVLLSPIGMLFWIMQRGYHDARSAEDEFKRTVNPEELRTWALMQIRKHPEGGDRTVSKEEWPKTFPHFTQSRGLSLLLDPAEVGQTKRDVLRAALLWGFSAGYRLKVTIWLNADGTPANLNDEPQQWAEGIVISRYSK